MTDHTELKRLAEAIQVKGTTVDMLNRWARFEAACKPELILGLIAENDRLVPFEEAYVTACNVRNRLIKDNELQDRLIVENKAISDSFLAERDQLKAEAYVLREENDNLRACRSSVNAAVAIENEALRKALADVRESVQREYWDEYAGLEETRAILDAALGEGEQS